MIQNNQVIVFAMIPYDHVLVDRRNDRPNRAVHRSPVRSTFPCLLTSAVRQYVHLPPSVQCSARPDRSDEYFLNRRMGPTTFRDRMEDARRIRDHVLSVSCKQQVKHMRRCLDGSD